MILKKFYIILHADQEIFHIIINGKKLLLNISVNIFLLLCVKHSRIAFIAKDAQGAFDFG